MKNKYIISVARTIAFSKFKKSAISGRAKIEAEVRMGKERECRGKT